MVTVVINNNSYQYPTAGDDPGWGGQASDAFVEVTEVLNSLIGPNDILQTNFNIANNQTSVADVTGLIFNGAQVRKATINYSVSRLSATNPSGKTEGGTIVLVYDGAAGTPWSIGQGLIVGNSGVNFSVTNSGQIQYTSTDIGSSGYSGVMSFSGITIETP